MKADATHVELGTPASATTIEGTQVSELALGTRNYEQLVSLMPGVSANTTDELYIGNSRPAGTAATMPYSINGIRNSANNWTVDGADNVDRGSNQTLMTFPSVDAIAEFKVERSLYTADTGRAGGAQINVVTKSGDQPVSRQPVRVFPQRCAGRQQLEQQCQQGQLVNGEVQVPPLRWNDFGGSFGGPVYIPNHYNKDKNKTFFFFSEEARRIHNYTTSQPHAADAGHAGRTYSASPFASATPLACQQMVTSIPSNLINPNRGRLYQGYFQQATAFRRQHRRRHHGSAVFPVQNIYNSRQEIGRVDHVFSENFKIWGKFENDVIPTTEPGGLFTGSAIPYVATTNTNSPGRSRGDPFREYSSADLNQRRWLQLLAERNQFHAGRAELQVATARTSTPPSLLPIRRAWFPSSRSRAARAWSATVRITNTTRTSPGSTT